MHVKRVEVVIGLAAVLGRVAVQTSERGAQDAQLLAAVVSDHAHLQTDARAVRLERDLLRLVERERRGIVPKKSEIVHRVRVQRPKRYLLSVLEHRLRDDRPRTQDVAIRQQDAARFVHHESGGVRAGSRLGVEGSRAGGLDDHDRLADPGHGALPLRVRGRSAVLREVQRPRRVLRHGARGGKRNAARSRRAGEGGARSRSRRLSSRRHRRRDGRPRCARGPSGRRRGGSSGQCRSRRHGRGSGDQSPRATAHATP